MTRSRVYLLLAGLLLVSGFLLMPWFDRALHSGIQTGWVVGGLVSALAACSRHRPALSATASMTAFALGFLTKLAILLAGALLGHFAGWFAADGFLLAFLTAALLFEGLAVLLFGLRIQD